MNGLQLTQIIDDLPTLATTNKILANGVHYLEVEIISNEVYGLYLGVCKLNLDPSKEYGYENDTDTWLMLASQALLFGNGYFEVSNNTIRSFKHGDKVGILLKS